MSLIRLRLALRTLVMLNCLENSLHDYLNFIQQGACIKRHFARNPSQLPNVQIVYALPSGTSVRL
jgi:hypothetical protein